LFKLYIGRREFGFAETVIHQYNGRTFGRCRGRQRRRVAHNKTTEQESFY